MVLPDPSAADPNTPPTVPDAGGSVQNQPDYKSLYETAQKRVQELEGQDWQKRATGWQRSYEAIKSKYDSDQARAKALEDEVKNLKTATADLEKTNATSVEELDKIRTDHEVTQAQLERLSVITKEFPDLLPFLAAKEKEDSEAVDVLPQATGDDLRKQLSAFKVLMGTKSTAPEKNNNNGASPQPPAPTPGTADALWKQAIDALSKGNMADYDNFYSQYLSKRGKE